jgi:hypothetical protein
MRADKLRNEVVLAALHGKLERIGSEWSGYDESA